jgi:hypothetical protein
VALDLLEPLVPEVERCGTCLEALLVFSSDEALARLREHSRGAAIAAAVADKSLPFADWSGRVAAALQTPKPAALEPFAHLNVPFVLSRVCPDCANPDRRRPEERELTGFMLLVKVASRFDRSNPMMGGIPLAVEGSPRCAGRCCRFGDSGPIAPNSARLEELCFRPLTALTAALTRVAIAYGPTATTPTAAPAPAVGEDRGAAGAPVRAVEPAEAPPVQPAQPTKPAQR